MLVLSTWKLCLVEQEPKPAPLSLCALHDSCCVTCLVTYVGVVVAISYLRLWFFIMLGESVSSDTALGYNHEAELSMSSWQTCEEDADLNTPTDVADSDARHWLQLSPADASNLTGN